MFIVSESGNPSNYIQVKPLGLPIDPFVVDFYRSREQADGKYGKGDKSYDGAFGFDRFDEDVAAEGRINEYPKLAGIVQKDKNISGNRDYLCPYLSIWPPNVQGNMNNTKNTVEVVVRLEKGKGFKGKCGKQGTAKLISSDPSSITIDGGPDKSLTLNLDTKESQLPTIKLECLKPFSSEVYITAEISNKVVGKLIIYPNDQRFKTTIQPVYVSFSNNPSTIKSVPTSSIPDIQEAQLKDYLNNKSFNQALIYSEVASTTHHIRLNRGIGLNAFLSTPPGNKTYLSNKNADRQRFNTLVKEEYVRLTRTPQQTAEIAAKQNAYTQSGMYQAVQDFMTEFSRLVNYNTQASTKVDQIRAAQAAHTQQRFTQAWNNPLINNGVNGKYDAYLKAEQRMKALLTQQGVTNETITPTDRLVNSVTKTIYVFYYKDIYASFAESTNSDTSKCVPGYTYRGGGISHIFSSGFSIVDAIVHEVGHGLGLPHTFSEELKSSKVVPERTREEIDQEIKGKKMKIDVLNTKIKSYNDLQHNMQALGMSSLGDYVRFDNLGGDYVSCLAPLSNQQFNTYLSFKNKLQKIQEVILQESNLNLVDLKGAEINPAVKATAHQATQVELVQRQTELTQLQAERKGASKKPHKPNYKPLSETMENYMDYDFDAQGQVVPKFQRKSFYKSQWDIVRNGTMQLRYLTLMP
ncbi:hypothetical protein AAG747_28350 [Rapidithrix thailandica]|uniref:Uncharacterized protein n=1 Tax=Rapidithrix thailandica TaxID=413964 RepID=A0AAW9SM08_9BACT